MARICCANTSKTKAAEFKLYAPQARRVNLAGSFNNWDTKRTSAKKDLQGNWVIRMSLKPGRYEYKFLVDGKWVNDPNCGSCVPNSFGTHNCIMEIR